MKGHEMDKFCLFLEARDVDLGGSFVFMFGHVHLSVEYGS